MSKMLVALAAAALATIGPCAHSQTLSGAALVKALRAGGYVLLMRHAASPMALPDATIAEPDNSKHERQLDAEGKASAIAMGQAFKALAIPVGRVLSSPTYRAQQTARLAQFPKPELAPELGENGQSMQAAGAAQGTWLTLKVAEPPRAGTDTIMLTHLPNIRAAYAKESAGLADGETLVFLPDGKGGAELMARVKIEDWPKLAAQR